MQERGYVSWASSITLVRAAALSTSSECERFNTFTDRNLNTFSSYQADDEVDSGDSVALIENLEVCLALLLHKS